MLENEVLEQAFAMPLTNPAYSPGPYRFVAPIRRGCVRSCLNR